MKLFVLIATIYNGGDNIDTYAIDTGITDEDCIQLMIVLDKLVADNVYLSCEFDLAANT